MARQARTGTTPEMALRRELHRRGLRFRVDYGFDIDGLRRRRADLAFTRRRIAVFVDGCFWHACPQHATSPKANNSWWAAKLAGNVARDRDTMVGSSRRAGR
jgi:DNA mismatch endonuclease (patch repair protein)